MKSLQLHMRAYNFYDGNHPTQSSMASTGAPQNSRMKWLASYGNQIFPCKIASKKLHQTSPKPHAVVSSTGPKKGEPKRSEFRADFPDDAISTSSGYLPISAESQSRLFYVFYEATNPVRRQVDTPIVLWLNGGPGCSNLIGCFYELRPWKVNEKLKLTPNEGAWNRRGGNQMLDMEIMACKDKALGCNA